MSKLTEIINERLINEYISKVGCCDECFASVYCTVNGLRESRVPQDYCVENIKRYFDDNADLMERWCEMSRTLLHDWESSIEKNKNNTEELLKIAEDIYNTAYARGKASVERPQGEWTNTSPYDDKGECSLCCYLSKKYYKFCPNCGAKMKGDAE